MGALPTKRCQATAPGLDREGGTTKAIHVADDISCYFIYTFDQMLSRSNSSRSPVGGDYVWLIKDNAIFGSPDAPGSEGLLL